MTISVFGCSMGELEIKNATECLKSQWIGMGEKTSEFENQLIATRNFSNFVMLDSGSNSLFLALKLLDLPKGSEVILPAFTWMACANAVVMADLIPVFADVDLITMNITAETIVDVISPLTSCIMVVHYAGLPVDMDPIVALGFPIIEDCAHAIYSDYKEQPCGSIGDIGVFSFDSVKNLAVGEVGGIVCKDVKLYEYAKNLRYCGIKKSGFSSAKSSAVQKETKLWWEYELTTPFIKMLPTDISASIGLAQLSRRQELQNLRKAIWTQYQEAFCETKEIVNPCVQPTFGYEHSYFTYVVRVNERDKLARDLLEAGIYTTLRYYPLNKYTQYSRDAVANLANTEILNQTSLSIPLHPRLTPSEVDYVIEKTLSSIRSM
jgi:aminotransferase